MTDETETLAPAPEPSAQPEPSPREPSGNLSDALDNAFDSVFEDQPEMQSGRARDDKGRFAPKAETPEQPAKVETKPEAEVKADDIKPETDKEPKAFNPDEPPSRLSADAKAVWKAAPVEVRADIHRAFSEMEQGIIKYRQDATAYQAIQPYENLAKQYGMNLQGVLSDYAGMSQMMATDPVKVFDTLAQRHGFTLQEVAAHVLQQDLDEFATQTAEQIKTLQRENAELKRQTQDYTGRQQQEIQGFVAEFAVKNPRYEELEQTIAGVLRSGLVSAQDPRQRLQEAYTIAERLKPGPQQQAPQNPALAVQTRKGQLSVTGAPGSGSDPARRKPPASAGEAVERALNAFGL